MTDLVVEHKSTTLDISPGTPYWKKLTLDAQIGNYIVGARALSFDPRGVLYDVLRRPTLRPLMATPEELRKYVEPKSKACPECKKKKPAAEAPHTSTTEDGVVLTCADGRIVTDPGGRLYANQRAADETGEEFASRVREAIGSDPERFLQRAILVRLDEEMSDAAFDVWVYAQHIREAQRSGRWPRNVNSCEAFGGFCEWWSICAGEMSLDDPTFFQKKETTHSELSSNPKTHLPVLSTSSLRAFRACPRRYYFSYERGYRVIRNSEALRFGTLIHKGLEVWWTTASLEAALDAIDEHEEKTPIDRILARELMRAYHLRWKDEPLKVLAVEAEFTTPLVNPSTGAHSKTWVLGGKIDAIASTGDA